MEPVSQEEEIAARGDYPTVFVKKNIAVRFGLENFKTEVICDIFHALLCVKRNVSEILAIVPIDKIDRFPKKACHDAKDAAWPQQLCHTGKLFLRPVKVFCYLAAGDEVVPML